MIAFWPITEAGMFLQIWTWIGEANVVDGEIINLPFGQMLMGPGTIVHGGGFMEELGGHLRMHIYVYPKRKVVVMEK